MRGTEALEADEEEGSVEATILQGQKTSEDKMNGTKNGASNEIKYPANCAMRLGSTPGSDGNDDDPFEPKQDRKVFRILTVIIYVFTVSFGAILLSLYYLFLWDPYKYTGPPLPPATQIPEAQSNSPATSSASIMTTPSLATQQDYQSTLSDEALDNLVKDLNDGIQPKTLALNMKALVEKEQKKKEEKEAQTQAEKKKKNGS